MTREQFSSDSKVRASLPPGARSWNPALLELWLEAWNQRGTPPGRTQPGEGVERRIDGMKYRFASARSEEQLDLASELVMRRYAWRGYDAEGAISNDDSAGEVTFLAQCGARIDGTLTVRVDGQTELLAEQLYPQEVARLRRNGAKLCEFGRLAFDEGINTLEILGPLFHLGMAYTRWRHACTDMLIEVNPRHAGFYQRVGGMKVLGDVKTCDRVAAPAVLLHLSLERAASRAEVEGGERTGRKSIFAYCFGRDETAALTRELASLGMGGAEGGFNRAYAL